MPWVSFQSLRFCSNSLQFCSRECSCIRLAASKLWLLVPLSFNFSPSTSLPALAPFLLFKSHPLWADHCFSTKSVFAQARYPETSSAFEYTNYQNQLETFLRWTQIQIRRRYCKAMRNPMEKQPWSALKPDKQLLRPGRPSPSPTSTSHGAHNCLSRPSATGTLTHNAEASSSLSGVSSSPEWTKLKWKTRGRRNHEAGCQLGARRNLWRLHILILKRCFSVFLHLIFKMKVWKSNGC